jgi:hypothetical protein
MNYVKLTATGAGLNYNLASNIDKFQFVNINRVTLVCDSTLGAINILLPKITNLEGFTNFEVIVNDTAGRAATNNITITVGDEDTDNILGQAAIILNKNYYKMQFLVASVTSDWMVNVSSCCTTTGQLGELHTISGSATSVVNSDFKIDETRPYSVVVTGESSLGTVYQGATMMPTVDFTIVQSADHTQITFTEELTVATVVMLNYERTDLIAP